MSNEELLIALRMKINFKTDQKAAAVHQTTGRHRLVHRYPVFGELFLSRMYGILLLRRDKNIYIDIAEGKFCKIQHRILKQLFCHV
jgi:hypothetical protein